MRTSQQIAMLYWPEVSKRYLQAVSEGRTDIAIILSLRNQEAIQDSIARQEGPSDVPRLGAVFRMNDRKSIARDLDALQAGNPAATTLATETPPEGTFPLIIVMDEGSTDTRIEFLYAEKPE